MEYLGYSEILGNTLRDSDAFQIVQSLVYKLKFRDGQLDRRNGQRLDSFIFKLSGLLGSTSHISDAISDE